MFGQKKQSQIRLHEEPHRTAQRESQDQPVKAQAEPVPASPQLLRDPRLRHPANVAVRASLVDQAERRYGNAALQEINRRAGAVQSHPHASVSFTSQSKEVATPLRALTGLFHVAQLADGAALSFQMDALLSDAQPAGTAEEEQEEERVIEEEASLPPGGAEGLEDRIGSEMGVWYTIRQGGSTGRYFGIATRSVAGRIWVARRRAPGDPSASYYHVRTRVSTRYMWNVNSRGRRNVSGPQDSDVTEDTWSQIVYDLTPAPTVPARSPRVEYWCRDLTTRHEHFHITDWVGAFRRFKPVAEAWLETLSVSSTAEALTRAYQAVGMLISFVDGYMGSGDTAPCEIRAYDDGAPLYRDRARAVEQRANREGWPPGMVILRS